MVKILFGLPLRQIEPDPPPVREPWRGGMVASILSMAGLNWPVLDFSPLSRRQKTIEVQITHLRAAGGPLNLLVVGTGIEFLGGGEWLARKHGNYRRRQDRKQR